MKSWKVLVAAGMLLCVTIVVLGLIPSKELLFDTPQYTITEIGEDLYLKFKPNVTGTVAGSGNLNCGMVRDGVRFSSVADAYETLSKGKLGPSEIQFVMDEFSVTEDGYLIFDFRTLPNVPSLDVNSVYIFSEAVILDGTYQGNSVSCFVAENSDKEFIKNELSLFLNYSEDAVRFGTESQPEICYAASDGTSRRYVFFKGRADDAQYYACTCYSIEGNAVAEELFDVSDAEVRTMIVGVCDNVLISFRCVGNILPQDILNGLSFAPVDIVG